MAMPIGFPEICGHPFCLDCILEWSKVTYLEQQNVKQIMIFYAVCLFQNNSLYFSFKTVQTCPYDRCKFDNILVSLDLEGEVVRTVPVDDNQGKDGEEDPFPDVTGCQVCQSLINFCC